LGRQTAAHAAAAHRPRGVCREVQKFVNLYAATENNRGSVRGGDDRHRFRGKLTPVAAVAAIYVICVT
jgi:hypothetical protein